MSETIVRIKNTISNYEEGRAIAMPFAMMILLLETYPELKKPLSDMTEDLRSKFCPMGENVEVALADLTKEVENYVI